VSSFPHDRSQQDDEIQKKTGLAAGTMKALFL
jgi:hypothetical protein